MIHFLIRLIHVYLVLDWMRKMSWASGLLALRALLVFFLSIVWDCLKFNRKNVGLYHCLPNHVHQIITQ